LPSYQDFILDFFWRGYPGPVLAKWEDLPAFLSSVSPDEMDELQRAVKVWYEEMRINVKQILKKTIDNLFPIQTEQDIGKEGTGKLIIQI
jgi:hypothetical protein